MKSAWIPPVAVCALVIGVYAYMAPLRTVESLTLNAADTYYNLLVQGVRAGQLNLKKEVPSGFASLADPYDPDANLPYRLLPYRLSDLSYYKGKFYLYYGITPALILFWPYVALSGHYLFDSQAVAVFCVTGFLASVGLLCSLWRRYFAEVSAWVVAACSLALALATGVPVLLVRFDVYQVAIGCGYMLTMLALAAIWCALHRPERRCWWLAAASLAYGLAVGARPNLLFGAVILLAPVVQAWRERQRVWTPLIAAIGPIVLIGSGLMIYNVLRFDNPFEFGIHYALAARRHFGRQLFSLRYLWFHFRVYFLEPARWHAPFPFVHEITVPRLPAGYSGVENPFGVLTNIPLVWLALAVPLAWRGRSGRESSMLRWFVTVVALAFGTGALTVSLFWAASLRYEVEFLPELVLLAVVGILGLERVLAPTSESGLADRPVRRRAVRWGWGLLLAFSVVFNVLVSVEHYAYESCSLGTVLTDAGRVPEGIKVLQKALRIKPDNAEAQFNLGIALQQTGNLMEAMGEYEQALRINPDYAEAHCNLGIALGQAGRVREAIGHLEQALRIKPDFAEAHCNLGIALGQTGRMEDAIGHYEQALRIRPDFAEAHCNLGIALEMVGRTTEAIEHYQQALKLRPDFAPARNALARLQAGQ